MVLREFAFLAYVDEKKFLAAVDLGLDLVDARLVRQPGVGPVAS